jgi:hypothetical protein
MYMIIDVINWYKVYNSYKFLHISQVFIKKMPYHVQTQSNRVWNFLVILMWLMLPSPDLFTDCVDVGV